MTLPKTLRTLLLFLSIFLETQSYSHYHSRRIPTRDLEDSLGDLIQKHIRKVDAKVKAYMKKAKAEQKKKKHKGQPTITQTTTKNGEKTVVKINGGHKVTKVYRNGKLIREKKEKIKNRGNSINISNDTGNSSIQINSNDQHRKKKKKNKSENSSESSQSKSQKTHKNKKSKKPKKSKSKGKNKKSGKKDKKRIVVTKEKESKIKKNDIKSKKSVKSVIGKFGNKSSRNGASLNFSIISFLIVCLAMR